jgi:hypothetical protein
LAEERLERTRLPEGTVEKPEGTIRLSFMKPNRILAVAGGGTGWLRIDGAPYYAAAHVNYDDQMDDWGIDDRHNSVRQAKDDRAHDPSSAKVHHAALAILREAAIEWVAANPDLLLRADLADAEGWLLQKEDRLADLEASVERMRQEVEEARRARDEAKAELDAVLAAGGPSVP